MIDFAKDLETQDDPFGTVDFNEPAPTLNQDNMVQLLNAFNPQVGVLNKPADDSTTVRRVDGKGGLGAAGDTKGGADRVNANSAATGVTATKDEKGQTVLSNIGSMVKPDPDATRIVLPNAVHAGLNSLRTATDIGSAKSIYDNLQQSFIAETTKIETQALQFAQNKLGVPKLEQMLAEAEASNRASIGWYPGIGDAPNTAKIRTELNVARGYADKEAQRYLETNVGYKMLGVQAKTAQGEMQRVQRMADKKELTADNKDTQTEEMRLRKEQELEVKAEAVSVTQLAKIKALSDPTEFQGLDTDLTKSKVKAYQLYTGNKNKSFRDAIDAEGRDLPALALMGNAYAEKLAIAQETEKTGMSTKQVEEQFKAMKKWMDDPRNIDKALRAQGGDKAVGSHQMLQLDVTKKNEVTATKIRLAMEFVRKDKEAKFLGDVKTWGSIDPLLASAVDASAKTTGKRDIDNVMTAYLGSSEGTELISKASQFTKLIETAAGKHEESIFGMPNVFTAKALVAKKFIGESFFSRMMNNAKNMDVTGVKSNLGFDLGNIFKVGKAIHDSPLGVELRGEQKAPIDPRTNRPFGE